MLNNYYFADCVPGYYGLQCSKSCVAPFYGVGCQKLCSGCPTSLCDVSYGCPRITGKNITILHTFSRNITQFDMEAFRIQIKAFSPCLFDKQLIEYNLHNYNILTIFSMQ